MKIPLNDPSPMKPKLSTAKGRDLCYSPTGHVCVVPVTSMVIVKSWWTEQLRQGSTSTWLWALVQVPSPLLLHRVPALNLKSVEDAWWWLVHEKHAINVSYCYIISPISEIGHLFLFIYAFLFVVLGIMPRGLAHTRQAVCRWATPQSETCF